MPPSGARSSGYAPIWCSDAPPRHSNCRVQPRRLLQVGTSTTLTVMPLPYDDFRPSKCQER